MIKIFKSSIIKNKFCFYQAVLLHFIKTKHQLNAKKRSIAIKKTCRK
jgi:hypothetical protein